MAAYGKGQMLGSGINPESFKQDYSGFARAAEIQAQGLQNLGASIGGAIQNFGEAKKEQKKVDAYNKASAKSIEAAITLGKSYEIGGVEETLAPFLKSYNDPNLSPIEKAALLDEGKAMIPNVFGRFDKSQAVAIENARNAPPPPAPLVYEDKLLKTSQGDILVKQGSDGQMYDPKTKYPIFDLQAYGEGKPPEVYSAGATSAADFIDGALYNFPNLDGTPGSMPPVGDVNPLLPQLTPEGAAAINAILAGGQLAPPVGEPPASIARPQQEPQYTPRYLAADETTAKNVESYRPFTPEEIARYGSDGQVSSTGKVYPIRPPSGTEFTTNPDGSTTYRQGAGVGSTGGLNKAPTTDLKEGEVLVADPTSPTGTKIVQVPSEVREKAKIDFTSYVEQMTGSYAKLDEIGKAVTGASSNPLNYIESTSVGQELSRMFGSEPQVLRDQINTMRPSIINVIRQASEMGAKGLDSEKELVFYLSALGDPKLPVEANIKALEVLDKVYGTGKAVSSMLKNYPELAKKVNSYKLALPKASNVAPTSGSSNIYEKHGVK